jgi:hypothetical protein
MGRRTRRHPRGYLTWVISVPAKIYHAPELRERAFGNEVEKGGHLAAWEQTELFGEEILAAFRSLR